MTEYSEERLSGACARADKAVSDLERQELVAKLCRRDGLTYASLTQDHLGPMLVAYQHQPIGEMHTTSPSALKDWYAQPYREDGSLGPKRGPYVNARAAAAALIPGRAQPEPGAKDAG